MHPEKDMNRVVNGQRYKVATATLLASNEYWDGHNFERHGRNTFLYKTRGGAFFRVDLTQWQGERDTLTPITRAEAIELYETLREHEVEYEAAFDAVVEEATAGRPTYYGEPMKQTAIWLPESMIAWLKSQPGTMSEQIRAMIQQNIDPQKFRYTFGSTADKRYSNKTFDAAVGVWNSDTKKYEPKSGGDTLIVNGPDGWLPPENVGTPE